LRVTLLSDPARFEAFVGFVVLYLGVRLLYETYAAGRERSPERGGAGTVNITGVTVRRVGYEFRGKPYSFSVPAVFALSLVVGVIGGVYSIGGGSIIAPFLVTIFALPVYTVARATLIGTFVTSVAGVAFFELLALTGVGPESAAIAPDWLLGTTLGIGGLAGTYAGARLQRYLPDFWIRAVLGTLVTLLALRYVF
jgi:uncharacterized membrane protein YfcA